MKFDHLHAPRRAGSAWLLTATLGLLANCSGQLADSSDDERGPEVDDDDAPVPDSPYGDDGSDTPVPPEVVEMVGERPAACANAKPDPGPHVVRRLTLEEIERSLAVATGKTPSKVQALLPADVRGNESFRNDVILLAAPAEFVSGAHELGKAMATDVQAVLPLAPCQQAEERCEAGFVHALGLRLLRRPLEDEQVQRFRNLFNVARENGDDFSQGAALVLRAMLQSPQFLYRMEREQGEGGVRTVDAFELASRLSFLAWGAGPDVELLEAAEAGRLDGREGVARELARLFDDQRARPMIRTFAREWLGIDHVEAINLDGQRYQALDDTLKHDMVEETMRLFEAVWQDDLTTEDLLKADFTFVSPALASLYGWSNGGSGWQRRDLGADQTRGGFLTHASFLTAHAGGATPKVVERGLTIFKGLLCQQPVPPPDSVLAKIDELQKPLGPGVTERTNADIRSETQPCGACHDQFDPLAFPFERYDAIGRYSEKDQHGNPLRGDGALHDEDGGTHPYEDMRSFVDQLAKDRRLNACLVEKPSQFALGRIIDREGVDLCFLYDVQARHIATGGTLRGLFAAIAEHRNFRLVRAD